MGLNVDLVAFEAYGEFLNHVPQGVNLVNIGSLSISKAKDTLARYMDSASPQAVLANGDRCVTAAFLARKKSINEPIVIGIVHHDLLGALLPDNHVSLLNQTLAFFKKFPMTFIYRKIDAIAAVSEGTAGSVRKFLGCPRENIHVIYNPVPIDLIREKALESAAHPWFINKTTPVIVSSGRLAPQKDFSALIRAFRLLAEKIPARLAIMGEGPERKKLEKLIDELELHDIAILMGFQENPFKYIARADLFALSSVSEGLPMVIAEAMAIGTPVVSTNCPSGPAELLRNHPERLAPAGDPEALARVMEYGLTLAHEQNDMTPYYVKNIAERYLGLIRSFPRL
jgi:glycosyltransferase involved in cell wall biosynthesis